MICLLKNSIVLIIMIISKYDHMFLNLGIIYIIIYIYIVCNIIYTCHKLIVIYTYHIIC